MQFNIQHLGPIQEAQLIIRPLTVLVGANSTGKTLAAYAFGAGMSSWYSEQLTSLFRKGRLPTRFEPLQVLASSLAHDAHKTGIATVDIVAWERAHGEALTQARFEHLPHLMPQFMGSGRLDTSKTSFKVSYSDDSGDVNQRIADISYEWEMGETDGRPLLRIEKKLDEPTLVVLLEGRERWPQTQLEAIVIQHLLAILSCFTSAIFFPISRGTSLELFPGLGSGSGAEESDTTRKPKVAARQLPMTWLLHMQQYRRWLKSSGAARQQLAEEVEGTRVLRLLPGFLEAVMVGQYEIDDSTGREAMLTFVQQDVGPLDLSVASSMIKELASLVVYLRAEAAPGDLVIIDEPELNLHPEAQLQMMEFLAMLVKADLRVVMTTHSPYMLDHLVNLMRAAQHPEPESISELFKLKSAHAFIPQDKVAVYHFENGTAENALREDGQIDLGAFNTASDWVTNLYFSL